MISKVTQKPIMESLREKIRRIERGTPSREQRRVRHVPLGIEAIDEALPWAGLPPSGLHEIFGASTGTGGGKFQDNSPATGFSILLMARLAKAHSAGDKGQVLWAHQGAPLYGPGLVSLGSNFSLSPDQVILLQARDDTEVLWAMEEGLRSGGLAAVLGQVGRIDMIASRRLQLASEAGESSGLLLRPPSRKLAASSALTRWRITAAKGSLHTPIGPAWKVELLRCRYKGADHPESWQLEWNHETGTFTVAADALDRPLAARPTKKAIG
jgi:protein ImuA